MSYLLSVLDGESPSGHRRRVAEDRGEHLADAFNLPPVLEREEVLLLPGLTGGLVEVQICGKVWLR